MTLGKKLSKLRRENNYTQEQLAGILGVSRQSISKWESDAAYPETDKLVKISEMYGCSLDYLLKESVESYEPEQKWRQPEQFGFVPVGFRYHMHEKKSKRTVHSMPLWHVGRKARGIVAVGVDARGVIAVGFRARGIVSFGLVSAGVISFGLASLGLLSIGLMALGVFAAGSIAVGIVTAGAIGFGIFSLGAVAVGDFSAGALAIGKYVAIGDNARAAIAVGESYAEGSVYQKLGQLTAAEASEVKELMKTVVPSYFSCFRKLIALFL